LIDQRVATSELVIDKNIMIDKSSLLNLERIYLKIASLGKKIKKYASFNKTQDNLFFDEEHY
jgi:hypothetical protein